MKRKILLLMATFVFAANILFANSITTGVPESVANEFSQSFSNAKDVRWEGLGNYYKATFEQDDKTLFVFYTDHAEFMGIAKNTLSDQLPDLLQAGLKIKYPAYWITELVKYSVADKIGYLVTLENGDEKMVLKSDDNQHWRVHTKKLKV